MNLERKVKVYNYEAELNDLIHLLRVVRYKNLNKRLTTQVLKNIPNIRVVNYLIEQGGNYNYPLDENDFWENYIKLYIDYLNRKEIFKRLLHKLPKDLCIIIHKYMMILHPINKYKKQLIIIDRPF